MPEPQQQGIQATSANYTATHGNAGFLTHWAGPGIEPVSSWMLVRFISTEPRWEFPLNTFFKQLLSTSFVLFFVRFFFFFFFLVFLPFLGPLPWLMEVPRLGVQSELEPPAYTRATATWDLSWVCDLHHSSRPRWILNPLSKAKDQIRNLMVPSQIRFWCATMGTLI